MATRTVGARVKIDGEKEYKEAISSLNKGNQVLRSEMQKLQAQFKGNTESTEFLTKKGELLGRQLLQQKDKVAEVRGAYENASKALSEYIQKNQASGAEYEALRRRVSDWEIQLNNAEAAQYDLQHAIEENERALQGETETLQQNDKALQDESDTVVGLGDTVSSLAGKLGVNLPEGATSALNGVKGFSAGSVAALGAVAAVIAAVVAAMKKLTDITLQAAANADEVATEAMKTGLGTKTIQEMQYAENLIDVSYSTISSTLTKLTKNIADASTKNTDLAAKFASLGVAITDTDGTMRSAEDVFYDMIDALGKIQNETERDALAMELMGKSAQDLNPLIIQGSDALRELAAEAEATGYVLDESQLKKLQEVDDAYQRMQLQLETTKKQMAVEFAPAAKEAMEIYSNVVKKAGDALIKSGLVDGMASLLESFATLLGVSKSAEDALPGVTEEFSALRAVLGGLAQFAAVVADAFNFIAGLNPKNWGSGMMTTALGMNYGRGQASNWQRVYMQQNGTLEQYDSYYGRGTYAFDKTTNRYYDTETGWYVSGNPYNAAGTSSWRGGLTWVGENGPELVSLPRGSQILSASESSSVGGDTYVFNIDARNVKELNQLVAMAESARTERRMRTCQA